MKQSSDVYLYLCGDFVFTWNYRADAYLRSKAPLAIYMFMYVAMKCIPDTLFGVKVNNSK